MKLIDYNEALFANLNSKHYHIYWRGNSAHVSDCSHSVLLGSLDEELEVLIGRIPMCENTLDNWQE